MSNFISYHWPKDAITSQAARQALDHLLREQSSTSDRDHAFQVLLESGDVAARCIAFDQFDHAVAHMRLGLINPYEAYRSNLLEKARNELTITAVDSFIDGRRIQGANHASALRVLARLGDETDLPRVTAVLSGAEGNDVMVAACLAATDLLWDSSRASPELAAVLFLLARDSSRDDFLREQAVCALGNDKGPLRTEMLRKVATDTHYPTAGHAARLLAFENAERHRELLERLCSNWPEDYPALEVRRLLSDPSPNVE